MPNENASQASQWADLPDETLVFLSRRRQRAAFEELVRRTGRLVWSRLVLETGSSDRADDLAQETFLCAWRSLDQIKEPAGFRGWLLSVAHNVAVDAARRQGRQKRSAPVAAATALDEAIHPQPGPPEMAQQNESRQRVLAALASLPQDYRQVLMLRYLAGSDYRQMSSQLGLSNGSLRGLLHRGMEMLRKKMKASGV